MTVLRFKTALRTFLVYGSLWIASLAVFVAIAAACEGGGGEECREKPTVTTEPTTDVRAHEAKFHATINPQGCETTYEFEYRPVGGTFVKAGGGVLAGGITGEAVSLHVSSLAANTKYEDRATASNAKAKEPVIGSAVTFTTEVDPPSVTTEKASEVHQTTARLNGTINTHESATTYYFEYGRDKTYGHVSSGGSLVAGTENVPVYKEIEGLEPGTLYHFRLVAKNSGGPGEGLDETFTTSSVSWTAQTIPNPTGAKSSRLTFDSCTAASACTSVGEFVNGGGTTVPLAERWNGTAWSAEAPPSPEGSTWSELLGVSCTASSSCAAAGLYESGAAHHALVESWNGVAWSLQTPATPGGATSTELSAISCTSSTACTAVGHYATSTSSLTLAERWNGTSWTVQSTPNPSGATESSLLAVSCASSTACTAAGYYYNSEGQRQTLAESWNGTEWSIKTTPNRTGATRNILLGVSCTSSSACTAVGGDFPSGGGPQETLVERWNGSAWSIQTSQNPSGSEASVLHGISCVSATVCTATGDYVNTKVNVTLVERWGENAWSLQSSPNPTGATFSALWSVWCPSVTECISPGYYKNESGTELALTEKES